MQNNPQFPFVYLQRTGGGSSLTVPSQSWLSWQAGIICILAHDDLYHVEDTNEECMYDWQSVLSLLILLLLIHTMIVTLRQ